MENVCIVSISNINFAMYHAQKGQKAPEVVVYPDDERVQAALNYALDKKWPFVVHIEFAPAESPRDEFMTKLEAFVLIHMVQLNHVEVTFRSSSR